MYVYIYIYSDISVFFLIMRSEIIDNLGSHRLNIPGFSSLWESQKLWCMVIGDFAEVFIEFYDWLERLLMEDKTFD